MSDDDAEITAATWRIDILEPELASWLGSANVPTLPAVAVLDLVDIATATRKAIEEKEPTRQQKTLALEYHFALLFLSRVMGRQLNMTLDMGPDDEQEGGDDGTDPAPTPG